MDSLISVVVDTDVLIEILRGRNEDIREQWFALVASDAALLCTPVSIAEIIHGARMNEQAAIDELFDVITCIPIDAEAGRSAGLYMRQFDKSHQLELADCLIAASCKANNALLWTRNRKHFPMRDIRFYPQAQ